jgi:FAD/FMN-containing dehydrogenase
MLLAMVTVALAHQTTVEGWGMRNRCHCQVVRPRDIGDLAGIFAAAADAGLTVGLRGAGCSYGDAALNEGNLVLDCTALNRILTWDAQSGRITVEPGVSIAQLWQRILPDGWWPTVVPGTSAVTIGGAAAMNVHGKNNWHAGSFGDSVLAFDLLLPSGETITCSRERRPELFYGAIGGLGLLGCFTSITLQTRRVYSGMVAERQTAQDSLTALLDALEAASAEATDLVAWIDTSARGEHLGRGLLKAGRDLNPGEDREPARSLRVAAQLPPARLAGRLPEGWLPRLARPLTSGPGTFTANRAQWLRGKAPGAARPHWSTYAAANFPLDAIPSWREAYRPGGGLIQHQSFVPRVVAAGVFRQLLERSQAAGLAPSFAVLKKHRPDDFLLSYLGDGYSLALDYPVRRGLATALLRLLSEFNDVLADGGGLCYFAKDSTVTAEQARRMYTAERLARFLALKKACDEQGMLSSDLYRRVFAAGVD